jgi:endonuclease/exonuclease/phosphatase family metal-dependent hydrolase
MALRFRLDHVFASPTMQFASYDGTRPFGDARSPFFGLSDHVPISATLQA